MSKQNIALIIMTLLATVSYMLVGFEITALGFLIALVVMK